MNKYEATFYDILLDIANAPDRLIGQKSFYSVVSFLNGYEYSLYRNYNVNVLFRWQSWIEIKFLIVNSAWSWARILEHSLGEDDAIQCLPELYLEFINNKTPYLGEKVFDQMYHKELIKN